MRDPDLTLTKLVQLDEATQAAYTVGLDYEGPIADLEPLLDLDRGLEQTATVAVQDCPDYGPGLHDAVARTLELAGALPRLATAKSIVVKIGLIEGRPPEVHVTPHPRLLESLLRTVMDAAPHATVCVADGPGHDRDTDYVLAATGVRHVLDTLDIAFVDLNLDDLEAVTTPQPAAFEQFMLPRTIVESDYLISFTKMKTHHRAAVTLGMKNLFGCVPGSVYGFPKTRLHYAGTARVIADLASIIQPDLTFIDAVVAMDGDGPLDGQPRPIGVLIAGENTATTDAVTAQMMDFAPILIPQFWYALRKGLLRRPELAPADQPRYRFAAPSNIAWIEGTASTSHNEQTALCARLLDTGHAAQTAASPQ